MSRLLQGGAILVALLTLVSFFGRIHWSADYAALFVPQLALLSLLLSLTLWRRKRLRWAIVMVGMLLLNGMRLAPYLPLPSNNASDAPTLRLFSYNAYYANDEIATISAEIERYQPDVVFLMEYSNSIRAEIEDELMASYPHHVIWPSRMTMGVALFSKLPFAAAEISDPARGSIPVVEASFEWDGQTVSFVGGHPWPPLPTWGTIHQAHMAQIVTAAQQAAPPLIVTGDFNASLWSYHLNALMHSAELRSAQRGNGVAGSWRLPLIPLHISLDHLLISDAWHVHRFELGQSGGSDHRPIVVDLQLSP